MVCFVKCGFRKFVRATKQFSNQHTQLNNVSGETGRCVVPVRRKVCRFRSRTKQRVRKSYDQFVWTSQTREQKIQIVWPLVVAAHVVFWNKQERQGVLIHRLIMYSVVLQCGGQTSRSRFNVDKRVAKSVHSLWGAAETNAQCDCWCCIVVPYVRHKIYTERFF